MSIGIIVAGGLAAAGCDANGAKACTLIGCVDQFSASVRSADGSFPSGTHRVETLVDGVASL